MRLSPLVPLALLALAAPAGAAAQREACPAPTFQAQLLTPPALRVPRDAAIVVGLFPGGTLPDLPAITLTRRRRQVPLGREEIAPGLFRLRAEGRLRGRWTLGGLPGAPTLLFGRAGVGAPPPRPRLERVERYLVASATGTRAEVRAHLAYPIPEGVVAVVVYWGTDPEPDLFVRAVPTARSLVIYAAPEGCAALPPGASEPPIDGEVRVAFVDAYGQLGPLSAPASL